MGLFTALLSDAALLTPRPPEIAAAVEQHLRSLADNDAGLIGPLLAEDRSLSALDRAAESSVDVVVLNTGGAGGLPALAGRSFSRIRPTGVISPLRDPSDLTGNAARVAAAARELDPETEVFVGLPPGHGWQDAVAAVEAEGLSGWIDLRLPPEQLIEQLSVFIEADLPFRAGVLGDDRVGLLGLIAAVDALIDDADPTEAIELLGGDPSALAGDIAGYDDARVSRVRRRLRAVDCGAIPAALAQAGLAAR